MSDQGSGSPWAAPPGAPAVQLPVAAPAFEPPYAAPAPPPAPSKRGRVVAVSVALVALVAGGVATALALSDRGGGGASSPTGAAERLVGALEDNDILGTIDALAPSERAVVRDQLQAYTAEGVRLGVFKEGLDLGKVPGYELSVTQLQVTEEPVNQKIAMVSLTGGRYHFATHTTALPLGPFVTDQLAQSDERPDDVDESGDLADLSQPVRFATVKEGGGWYASLFYTAAEAIRRDADAPPPDPNVTVAAVGSDSPEHAVDDLVGAVAGLDVRRLIELSPPDELAVLHEYGPQLVDAANQARRQAGGTPASSGATVRTHEYDTKSVKGGTKVLPTHLVLDVTDNGEAATIEVTKLDGACVHVVITGSSPDTVDEKFCAEDVRHPAEENGVSPQGADVLVRELGQLAEVGVVTVKVDGKWYVSPARTLSDLFLTFSTPLQRQDLDGLREAFSGYVADNAPPLVTLEPPTTGG
jgi:hypothetical protein